MKTHRIELALSVAVLALVLVAMSRWQSGVPELTGAPQGIVALTTVLRVFDKDSLDEAAGETVERDPFRLSRLPPTVAFAGRGSQVVLQGAPAYRPALVLKGIVGGPPWQAVIDGIPGQPAGTVVKAGSAFDKLTIRSVSRDTVVVQMPDTTVRLTLVRGIQ